MSYPAKTVFYFSFYMLALSLTLLIYPQGLSGYASESFIWIRLIGMFLLYLALYYFQSARGKMREFFFLTVYTRATIPLFMLLFTVLGVLKPIFVALSLIDLAGAVWTWRALKSEHSRTA